MIAPVAGLGLLDELRSYAEADPDAPALLAPGREPLRRGELWELIESMGRALRGCGVSRGDVVAIALPDSPEMIAAILSAVSVASCAPLNPGLLEAETAPILRDLDAALLLAPAGAETPAAAAARRLGIPVVEMRAGAFALAALPDRARAREVEDLPEGTALLLHTSATTGRPKLVPLTHSRMLDITRCNRRVLQLGSSDRFLGMMPLFHMQGLNSVLSALLAGGSVVCTAGFEPAGFLSWLEEFEPTWFTAGPALYRTILAAARERPEIVRRRPLRFLRSTGAALPVELRAEIERVFGAPVSEAYGSTEAGLVTAAAPGAWKPGSCGRSAGPEIAVLDESGATLPVGAEGEIAVRGASVMDGYYRDAEATREAFFERWFRTGDLGRLDEEGELFLTGRIKEMINRGGEKVSPSEVDAALSGHEAVEEVAAFGVPHPTLGEDVAAAVVLRPGRSVTEAAVRSYAGERMAAFKVPRRVVFLERIPRSATGKPRRGALAEQFQALLQEEEAKEHVPASTRIEREIAGIWSGVLQTGREIGIHDDFFRLGGDSFAALLMFTELRTRLGVDQAALEAMDFFADPTIATLARLISAHAAQTKPELHPALVGIQPGGSSTPLFCVPGAKQEPYYFRHLAGGLGAGQPVYALRDPRSVEDRGEFTVEELAGQFVTAIRSLQPEGPYLLAGHCFGGMVVYEMGRQLLAQGAEIRVVALIDTPRPGYPKVIRERELFWKKFLLYVAGLRRAGWRKAAARTTAEAAALAHFVRGGKEPAGEIAGANERAAQNYEPGRMRARIVQFIGLEGWSSEAVLDPKLGWRELIDGPFEIRKVRGNHETMLLEPHAAELAAALRDCI